MRTITTTEDLAAFCAAAKDHPYVTIDTEFLRERTYWSKLCLIQMALPASSNSAEWLGLSMQWGSGWYWTLSTITHFGPGRMTTCLSLTRSGTQGSQGHPFSPWIWELCLTSDGSRPG